MDSVGVQLINQIGEFNMQGRIKHYNTEKGFGFIIGEDSKDYFFHVSSFKASILPSQGMALSFKPGRNDKGFVAEDVTVVQDVHPFLSINGHDIKKSNIKNYGISGEYRYYQRVYTLVKEKNVHEGGKLKTLFKEMLYGTHTFTYVKSEKMHRISEERFNKVIGEKRHVYHVLKAVQGEQIGWQLISSSYDDRKQEEPIIAPFSGYIDLNHNDFGWKLSDSNETIDKSDVMRRKERFIYITTYQGDNFKFYENQFTETLEERLDQVKLELVR